MGVHIQTWLREGLPEKVASGQTYQLLTGVSPARIWWVAVQGDLRQEEAGTLRRVGGLLRVEPSSKREIEEKEAIEVHEPFRKSRCFHGVSRSD